MNLSLSSFVHTRHEKLCEGYNPSSLLFSLIVALRVERKVATVLSISNEEADQ